MIPPRAEFPVVPPAERQIPGLSPTLKRRARIIFRLLTTVSPALAARVAAHVFVRPRARAITHEDARFLQTARSRRLSTPQGELQAYAWPASGPTVLVSHGWISHAARLRAVIEALLEKGLSVVAFDAPAHGRSAGNHADLNRFREALVAVSQACGPIEAIVAHSFGALAAASWLAEDYAASRLQAAVLVGVPRDVGYLFDSFTIALGLRADVVARLRALFLARYGRYPEQYSACLLAQHIRAPVLLVHGGDDELVPVEHAGEIVLQLPNGHIRVLAGMNHSGPLRDAQAVQLMAEFVAERLLTGSTARTALAR